MIKSIVIAIALIWAGSAGAQDTTSYPLQMDFAGCVGSGLARICYNDQGNRVTIGQPGWIDERSAPLPPCYDNGQFTPFNCDSSYARGTPYTPYSSGASAIIARETDPSMLCSQTSSEAIFCPNNSLGSGVFINVPRPWNLITQSYSGTISLIPSLSKDVCLTAKDKALKNVETPELKDLRDKWREECKASEYKGMICSMLQQTYIAPPYMIKSAECFQ